MTETNDIATGAGSHTQTEGSATSHEKDLKDAYNYIVNGKRHLLVQDFNSAVISLEEATRIYDRLYGVGGDECGDAYLHYGSALLELSRQETGALDGGVVAANIHESSDEEEEEEDDDDDDEEGENGQAAAGSGTDGEQAATTNGKENGQNGQGSATATDEDIETSDNEVKAAAAPAASGAEAVAAGSSSEPGPSTSAGPSADPMPGTSSGPAGGDAEMDDLDAEDAEATSAEVAWEVLVLARDVFRKQLDKGPEYKLKLAEALQKLGEISIEWENYANAIELLGEALSFRKEVLPEDDRIIAETYYHIGVSFSFSAEFERANDCYQSAVDVIESRLQNLRKFVAETAEATEEKSQKELEIIDLEGLLPEMKAKIEDSKDQMNQAMQQKETEESKSEEQALKINEPSDKPVNNISHLIKRKRESDSGEPSPKKIPTNPAGGDAQPAAADTAAVQDSTPSTTA